MVGHVVENLRRRQAVVGELFHELRHRCRPWFAEWGSGW
jgi:hypothetical protein